MIDAVFPSLSVVWGSEDGHIPTSWRRLYFLGTVEFSSGGRRATLGPTENFRRTEVVLLMIEILHHLLYVDVYYTTRFLMVWVYKLCIRSMQDFYHQQYHADLEMQALSESHARMWKGQQGNPCTRKI